MWLFGLHVCMCTVYTLRACEEEGTGPPETGATDVIRNHVGSKNWTQAPWKSKHPVPLTTEPPLQLQLGYFKVELQECPKWRISLLFLALGIWSTRTLHTLAKCSTPCPPNDNDKKLIYWLCCSQSFLHLVLKNAHPSSSWRNPRVLDGDRCFSIKCSNRWLAAF